jgi:signal transduction histidine kinase
MLALLGGTMTWNSVEPSGTHVEISVPNQSID